MTIDAYRHTIPVPDATRFPVELRAPDRFRPDSLETWPRVDGRLEWLEGRLLYMPPCSDVQQDVTGSVAGVLDRWLDEHPEFTFGTNEAGMILRSEVRGADAAVWLRSDVGPYTGGYRRVPPLLAVEVAGRDEGETELRDKAAWYLEHGVKVVWLVLPETREVLVVRPGSETRHTSGGPLPGHPDLPGLAPDVGQIFKRLD